MAPLHAAIAVALCGLVADAATLRQPVTAKDAVAASEKLEPAATPVSKVIQLLKGLEKQIEEEGAKEAAEYDKFACFCKEQADEKQYMIEKSEEKIEKLDASIGELDSEINALNLEIGELGDRIEILDGKIKTEVEDREKEHELYKATDKELADAIKSVDYALKVLRSSRDSLKDAKLSEALLQKVAGHALALAPLAAAQGQKVSPALLQTLQKPAAYQYKSSSVIETLMGLRDTFAKSKKSSFMEESDAKSQSDKKVLGWSNEKKFKEEDKTDKEALSESKTEEMHSQQKDKDLEEKNKGHDEDFRGELQTQCENRATEWDQRSKARSEELTAISEATEILKTGVEGNYAANKKLVGLASKSSSVAKAPRHSSKPVSLFQLRGQGVASAAAAAVRHVVETLESSAKKLGSAQLTALATKAALQEDHFVKVRGLIQDLIDRLEAEAAAEATQKSECDKEIGAAVDRRDEQKSEMEKEGATIAKEKTSVAQLTEDISVLSKEIAELQKGLMDATTLREEESKANAKTVEDAKAGLEAVDEAISVLKAFYDAQGFVQLKKVGSTTYEPFHAEGGDREGNTVDSLAPEMSYEGDYKGKASGGVLGLMQVIKSDFERTIDTVETAEGEAKTEFENYEKETKDSVKEKGETKDTKEGLIDDAEAAIVDAKDAHMDADKLHEGALDELDKLKAMCVEGAESYEERAEKREQEIEALKEALGILDNFK